MLSAPEHTHLNGAFYHPPIQPQTKPYHRPGCISETFCKICIVYLVLAIIILLVITLLIFMCLFFPKVPKFQVDDASLTRFTFSPTNNTLYYNLVVNMTFRNPSTRVGNYYDKIEAKAVYHGQRFGMVDIQGFYLGHKTENNVSVLFKGEQLMVFDDGEKLKYNSENKDDDDIYIIDLKFRLKMANKVWQTKVHRIESELKCSLKVPL